MIVDGLGFNDYQHHHPRARKMEEGALIVVAKIILLLNVSTIVRKMMMTRRARKGTRKRRKPRRTRKGRRRVDLLVSHGMVTLPQVMMNLVMMTRPPRRRLLQALLLTKSLPSLTLLHASWLRPLRYKIVLMRNMIIVKVKVMMMMNQLKMN
jgi:hypothetical protein